MDGEVMEGFICPICYKDLKTAFNLSNHFQIHSQDDQKLLKSMKEIYEKAKKKITKSEASAVVPEEPSLRKVPGYPPSNALDFENVASRSHTSFFKAVREIRNERYAAQTNTLLIRLEKLLKQLPSDPIRRKAYEQEIVPWLDEKNVTLCPSCAKPFNLLKRKHHCRLCGSIMCKNCTFLLSLDAARKMIEMSCTQLDDGIDSDFRICEHCHRFLATREMVKANRNDRPIIAQFYERLCLAITACDKAVDEYLNILNSLMAGESIYSLEDAKILRIELLRMADTVDSTSKNIAILGQNTESPPKGSALKLQISIRNHAALYLKKRVISLPSLPTEEQIAEYEERRRLEIERRIEEDRQKEMENTKIFDDRSRSSKMENIEREEKVQVAVDEGWTPSVKQAIITDDPLLQQIGILHGFIEQAQRAGKMDECAALRRNLMELEDALDSRESVH